MAFLVPSLVALRAEFNSVFPARDKATDGWIGDAKHSARVSDHNPTSSGAVHAIDVDRDLRGVATMKQAVDLIVNRHRGGRDNRLKYVIFERRIASASRGWVWDSYLGDNPHTQHAHFSGAYTKAAENSTAPWGLSELKPFTPRKVETMDFTVSMPVLREGDRDSRLDGYDLIVRVQRILRIDADGIWGPATTAAIAAWCKMPAKDCKVMT